MRTISLGLLGLLLIAAAGCPKPPPPPKAPPPPPAPQLGQACQPAGPAAQGNCAAGLACMTAGGASFCTTPCPCSGGVLCAATPSAPEMCLKPCAGDAECGTGLTCNLDYKSCAPAGLLVAKPPTCSEAALARKAFAKVTPISSAKAGGPTYEPAVAVDRGGNVVVAYSAGTAQPKLLSANAAPTADFAVRDADRPVPIDRESAAHPWLATDRAGKLYLVARGWNGGLAESNAAILLLTSEDGLSWSKAVVASDANDCAGGAADCVDKPIVAIGPDRNNPKADVIYVIYWSNVSHTLRATHSTDGGQTFSASAQVGTGGFADADVTSSGKLHVVYVSGVGNRMGDSGNGVYYTSSSDGGESFAPSVRISGDSDAVPYWFGSPRVIVDVPRKMLYAAYAQGTPDGKWDVVLATSKDGGITFGARQKANDDGSCATHMLPAAALEPATGRIHLAWVDNRSGAGEIAYTSCAPAGGTCAKNEIISDTPFAAFGYGRRSTATLGDYIALIADPKHKLLHAVWAQPVQEGGAPVTRLFHAATKIR